MYLTVEDTFTYFKYVMPENSYLVEFGVFSGNTMKRLIEGAIASDNPFQKVIGLDSFLGIPAEKEGVYQNPEWPKGAFSVCNDFGLKSVNDAVELVKKNVGHEITLIPGFFEQTLTNELAKGLVGKIGYAHIDCDLYISTIQVLEWIFKNNLLAEKAIVRFDDWLYNLPQPGGNNLAFVQTTAKYRISWDKLADNVYVYLGCK